MILKPDLKNTNTVNLICFIISPFISKFSSTESWVMQLSFCDVPNPVPNPDT